MTDFMDRYFRYLKAGQKEYTEAEVRAIIDGAIQEEREACAKVCEEEYNRVKQTEAAHYRQTPEPFLPQRFGFNMSRVRMSAELADAIRARGQE